MRLMLFFLLTLISSFVLTTSIHAEQAAMFSLKSSSFTDSKAIPVLYSCDGKDLSPQMSWSGIPAKTQSLALICEDPDAPAGVWYHWVLYNIPSAVSELPEGASLPTGASLGKNSWGRAQYNGPCPPASSTHRYVFTLYALDSHLQLPPGVEARTVLKAIQGHVLEKTAIMGVFGH